MTYSNQPYDMNPAGDFDLGAVADIPSCEFWDHRNSDLVDALYSCIEATSIGHILNKRLFRQKHLPQYYLIASIVIPDR